MITSSIELITPEKAKELINFSESSGFINRKKKEQVVNRYAEDMKNGNWMPTGQGISVSEEGVILDGYHRLYAVIKSNCSVPFIVTRGLNRNSFKFFDMGVQRTVSDIAYIHGYDKQTAKFTTTAIMLFLLFYQRKNNTLGFDSAFVLGYCFSHEQIYKKILPVLDRYKEVFSENIRLAEKTRSFIPSTVFMTLFFIFHDIDKTKCTVFFEKLVTGLNLYVDDPIYILREKLKNTNKNNIINAIGSSGLAQQRNFYYKNIITAWNSFYNNKKRKSISVKIKDPIKIEGLNEYEFAKKILSPEDLAKAFPEETNLL